VNENDKQRIKAMFPHASADFLDVNIGFGLRAKADQPTSRSALECPVERKEEVPARVGLFYVLYRIRLLDPDALDGATKVCTDCLCQAGLLPGDGPEQIELRVEQEKVSHRNEQKTTLTIRYP
jgi:hypothetical protein